MNTIIHFLSRRFALAVFLVASSAVAQVGNDNPTGLAGRFNGNVTTGCSYDPYTANATRSITDLTVAGGVSAYPLAFTRISNSRAYNIGSNFGDNWACPGSWQDSYAWSIPEQDFTDHNANPPNPAPGYVNFPDGRVVLFSY